MPGTGRRSMQNLQASAKLSGAQAKADDEADPKMEIKTSLNNPRLLSPLQAASGQIRRRRKRNGTEKRAKKAGSLERMNRDRLPNISPLPMTGSGGL
ncbi:MAG: hypothetical protein C6P37_03215 [Caldibacillus debilis]|uniref:Uncharacterized protein n=1 Tax=Caldibacillus debilis TaxID=301148 RepID=A0A3E0K7V4_9BACI|nr:MAG: hypothetical protein C6P37_03215 [Caldibacillus debilis]